MTRLEQVMEYAENKLKGELTAHDFSHSLRVMKIARHIGEKSQTAVDLEIIQVAAIIHDIIDIKVTENVEDSLKDLREKLGNIGYDDNQRKHIFDIIQNMSFSSGRVPLSEEGKIVQDADRLEAVGAIAIARTFAYGGKLNRILYEEGNDECSIAHFYEKLLLLKDMMNTDTGKGIAEKRHEFMENYLKQFHSEWNLEDLQ